MTPKGANLEATDLIEVSTIESGSYVTRSITGQEIIDGAKVGEYISRSFTQSVGSAATGETQLLQLVIPANTFKPTDKLSFFATFSKVGTATSTTHRIKISTSASMPTGVTGQIAQFASTNTQLFTKINRDLTINGGTLKGYPFTSSAVIDAGVSTSAISSVAFDVTVTQYLYVSVTPSSTTTDVTRLEAFEIRNI